MIERAEKISDWHESGQDTALTIFGRELVDVCVKFHAALGRRAPVRVTTTNVMGDCFFAQGLGHAVRDQHVTHGAASGGR